MRLQDLTVKLFADSADRAEMVSLANCTYIRGFTTNPTLMAKAGVKNYEAFARDVLGVIREHPVSFEVFADDFPEMERQAHKIAGWAPNVYVKIPVTNTKREPSLDLIGSLAHSGIKVNVTAILTLEQVHEVTQVLVGGAPSFVSVFAGRIADTGRDPLPIMTEAVEILKADRHIELIWASPRELLNIVQAESIGCHVITVLPEILKKLAVIGRGLEDYSLETVRMFYDDAQKSGFRL